MFHSILKNTKDLRIVEPLEIVWITNQLMIYCNGFQLSTTVASDDENDGITGFHCFQ